MILRHADPMLMQRHVVLPREGYVSELLGRSACFDSLSFEPGIIENPFEPWSREMVRDDFSVNPATKALRLTGNIGRVGRGMARLAKLVRTLDVDLIFCNGTSACFVGGALGIATRTPTLWHVFYSSVGKAVAPVHRALAKSRWVTRIACVSNVTTHQFDHVSDKVTVLHDAIDVERFSLSDGSTPDFDVRRELGLPTDAVLFGSQGRVVPKKGYRELIEAASQALAALTPEERARFFVVVLGDTPEDSERDHLAECRAEVDRRGLAHHVRFIGFRKDVRPYLRAFEVVVIPSVYPDPLPRSVMEAMAMEKPVLAFDVGGIGEMVVAATGVLAPANDTDALARGLVRYLQEPALRRAHGQAGRARALEEFDARAHAPKLARELLRAAGRPEVAAATAHNESARG
jgi:glycosyltransferase involved in cell wall biosynthesis